MKLWVLAVFLIVFPAQDEKKLQKLQKETSKLERQNDPVRRTKSYIEISAILLDLAGEAAKASKFDLLEQRLNEYRDAVHQAHETMINSGRDPSKKHSGFKDLEISIRRQLRQLEDMSTLLTFEQREPVKKAISEVSDIRGALLKALFGKKNVSPDPT